MTLYLEPLAIETESRNMAGQEGTLQYFHIKTIKSDVELYGLLARKYGNKFEVEMRHNVYRIKTPHGSAALSLDEPDVRSILRPTTRKRLDRKAESVS